MKLLKAEVHNFGSYKDLEFDFNDLGLALIHGATGSGDVFDKLIDNISESDEQKIKLKATWRELI